MIVCPTCCATVAPGMQMCPGCKGWITAATIGKEAQVIPLSEITSAEFERLKVGGAWDRSIEGGVPLQTLLAVTGPPGSGKSTVLQHRVADYLRLAPDRWAYYLSAEQAPEEVRRTFGLVLGHIPDRLLVPKMIGGGMYLSPETLAKYPPIFVVVDSVTRACGKDLNAAVEMGQYFKDKVAVAHRCIAALVYHVNKSDDISGREGQVHDADVLMAMDGWERGDPQQFTDPDFRKLEVFKSRVSPAHTQVWFRMTGTKNGEKYHGLEEVPEKAERITSVKGLPGSVLELQELREEFRGVQSEWRERIAEAERYVLSLAKEPPPKGKDTRTRKPRAQAR